MSKAVAYFRVSTAGQGRSGLGLEAQRKAVTDLIAARGLSILAEFTEIESGKRNDRPELESALRHARLTGAILVIAKLDRLSRNASFLLSLRDSGAKFIAADMPDANDVTIGILAVIAQAEREATSRRTTEALSVIKAKLKRGETHHSRNGRTVRRLGNPNGSAALNAAAPTLRPGAEGAKAAADRRAEQIAPAIMAAQKRGLSAAYAIAADLNRLGFLTPRRGRWHASTVSSLIRRISAISPSTDA
jgi:DNA invertase Pin-like site-specific DNA recombinase